jgi:hypothetical protein
VLRVLLWLWAGGVGTLGNREARDLARRAGASRDAAASVLAEGLNDSRVKVRAAAAHLLSRPGTESADSLPDLVRRFYEPWPTIRSQTAAALARILPALPAGLQTWLCLLVHPLHPAEENLQAALTATPPLPVAVRQAFAELLARRAVWWGGVSGQAVALAAPPADGGSLLRVARLLAERAGDAALKRSKSADSRAAAREAGRQKEFAWLIARLCELLQAG